MCLGPLSLGLSHNTFELCTADIACVVKRVVFATRNLVRNNRLFAQHGRNQSIFVDSSADVLYYRTEHRYKAQLYILVYY